MPAPHGAHKKGLILCLPDLVPPTWQELSDLRDSAAIAGITHLVCVSNKELKSTQLKGNWKFVQVLRTTREDAIEIAKRHCAMCEEVIVLNKPFLNDQVLVESLAPARECDWAPVRGGAPLDKPWEGVHERKPWDFACEVVLPCLDCNDMIEEVVALWRLQTVKPYLVLIDTGSTPKNLEKLMAMRADDLEVHSLRFNGVHHPSDFPAVAMDLAFSMCRTEKLVASHTDVFLRHQHVLESLLWNCQTLRPAVGYQMTEREHPGWEKVVSHTLSAFHMPTMWKIGAGWSLARLCARRGIGHWPNSQLRNMPDTEVLLSDILEENGIKPFFIGTEKNEEQTVDKHIRHVRSRTGAQLYSPAHMAKTDVWLAEALVEARQNIMGWSV